MRTVVDADVSKAATYHIVFQPSTGEDAAERDKMRQKKAVPKWCATHPQSHWVGWRQQVAGNHVFLFGSGVNVQKKPRVSRSENYLWRLVYSCLQEGDGGCQWIEGRSVLVLCKILESSSVLGTQSANSKSQCPHWHSAAVNRTKEDYFSGVQQQQGIDPDSIFGRVPRCVTGLRSMVVSGWTIGGPAIPTVIQVFSATAASKVMDDVFPESLYQQAACFRHVKAKPCEHE